MLFSLGRWGCVGDGCVININTINTTTLLLLETFATELMSVWSARVNAKQWIVKTNILYVFVLLTICDNQNL